jgi:glyoxylase-like metal-dependent hydrolase (beta-lactamase superfamily II)
MADFAEVAPRVWVARHAWMDVNVTLVGGDRGLLLVDTHSSGPAAREVVADVGRLGAGEVIAVVNTHEHWDHTLGNAEIRAAFGPVPIHAHEWAAAHTVEAAQRVKARFADSDDPHAAEVIATMPVAADHTFSSARVLDLGERVVELVHPGRGHTAGDLVVRIPDADAVLAGDLVEESGPPAYGSDSWPLEWPLSLDIVLGLSTSSSVLVPGHGAPVGRDFVEEQRNAIGVVAETIRDLAGRGVPLAQAVEAADWPFPPAGLTHAVARGYQQLPRSQKRLPLL